MPITLAEYWRQVAEVDRRGHCPACEWADAPLTDRGVFKSHNTRRVRGVVVVAGVEIPRLAATHDHCNGSGRFSEVLR